jgi:phosphohistidine phosphatase
MAKNLILVRHAKSDWGNFDLKDFDRPLNQRGLSNAPEMGKRLFQKNILPDAIVSSTALRAITTAQLIALEIGLAANKIVLNPHIYLATEFQLLNVINQFDNGFKLVAIFGHNPGISEFANYLTNSNIYNLPTCGMVLITFDTDDWATISGATGKLVWYDYPKNNPQ